MVLYTMASKLLDASAQASGSAREDDLSGTHILDLPCALLSRILSRVLDPVAAVYLACSCRTFRALSKSIPFCFKVSCAKMEYEMEIEEVVQKKHSLTAIRTWTRCLLSSIRTQMPMTKALDLSGCWILDEDIAAVLADLRYLKYLILDGCQKLTSAVVDALAVSVRVGPYALSLQRCFGLCPAAAGNLLAAAAAEGSQLQCVLLSHLDRLDLPRYAPMLDQENNEATRTAGMVFTGPVISSHVLIRKELHNLANWNIGITVLALHNCGNLGAHEIAALGITCPRLEYLLIGGSVEALHLRSLEVAAPVISALVDSIKSLRCLRVLEATFFPEFVIGGLREQVREGVEVWNFCESKSVFSALAFVRRQGTAEQVFHGATELNSYAASKYKRHFTNFDSRSEYMSLALRAAVNCSDLRRCTPLHFAVNYANLEMLRGLLIIGASPDLKDSRGGTALFDAAWKGHIDICKLLLMSGADVLSRNRSGENPLYAAALKGYTSIVKTFVLHCEANNVNWQSSKQYGDGWTPLMAAAVADRQDVAKVLLEAAGLHVYYGCTVKDCMLCRKNGRKSEAVECKEEIRNVKKKDENGGEVIGSSSILDAQNRYGQTALHIAARRGSEWFVCYLLHAGASLDIEDEYRRRPVDLAQKNNHAAAAKFLKQWELQLKQPKLESVSDRTSKKGHSEASKSRNITCSSSESTSARVSNKPGLKTPSTKQVWRAKERDNPI
ncbi:hypothetical protein KP509_05G093700 [Ceratopteris richardii]|uniref:Uncharacterized protein n=1 Tax=Ceratopteris richardii TaxID=49495 RepID=A0A8T2UWQ1_CERRI|nr:hypothetical protein KP509_05G093700 [Ceratopteris richardii]